MSDKIPDNFIADVVNSVDVDKIKNSIQNGDINMDELQNLLSQILGTKNSEKILERTQQTVNDKGSDSISGNSISQILDTVSIDEIKQSVENDEINVDKLQNLLLRILGKDGSEKIIDKAKMMLDGSNKKKK